MAAAKGSRRSAAVTRDEIVQTAIVVADAEGLGALSMRAVAGRIGVEAMSLYHHVANKEAMLDGMVDAVFSEFHTPRRGADWAEEMRERSRSARQALKRHPWAVGLMDSRRNGGPATLQHHDAVLGCLREAGFSLRLTGNAFALLDAHLYGFLVQELSLPFENSDELAEVGEEMLAQMPMDALPYLREFAVDRAFQPGYDFGDEFDVGLDLILEGLAVRLATESP